MRFQSVRRHTRIVPPNLVQQHVAGNNAFGRAVQELENICFLFRQADFLVLFRQQHLLRGLEGIWPKLEHRIFGLFVLAQLRADTGQKNGEFEWLGDVIIRTSVKTQNGVAVAVMPCEHHNRAFHALLAHQAAQFTAICVRQAHVKDHQIIERLFRPRHCFGAVTSLEDIEIFCHNELFAQRLAQVLVIIDKQDFLELCHESLRFCWITDVPKTRIRQVMLQIAHGLVWHLRQMFHFVAKSSI